MFDSKLAQVLVNPKKTIFSLLEGLDANCSAVDSFSNPEVLAVVA